MTDEFNNDMTTGNDIDLGVSDEIWEQMDSGNASPDEPNDAEVKADEFSENEFDAETDAEDTETAEQVVKPEPSKKRSKGYYAWRSKQAQEMDRLRRENAQLSSGYNQAQQAPAAQQQTQSHEGDEAAQLASYIRNVARQEIDQEKQVLQEQENHRHFQEIEDEFGRSVDDAASRYNDFDTVFENESLVRDTSVMAALKLQPNAGDVMYYLNHNKQLMQQIKSLPPLKQARKLAEISHEVAAKMAVKKASGAPHPLSEGKSSGQIASRNKSSEKMNQSDHARELKDWGFL